MASAPSSVARLAIVPLALSVVLPAAACNSMGKGFFNGSLRYNALPVRPCAVKDSFCHVPRDLNDKGNSEASLIAKSV